MIIREYQLTDCKELAELFYNTVHTVNAKDYTKEQGKGIATAICNQLESAVQENIVVHASVTAKPFFEKRGYEVIKEQQVERQGIFLTNFVMIKINGVRFRC